MEMSNDLSQVQQLRISPRLIQANHILELSSLELQQAIQQETYQNPALEVTEKTTCPVCGNVMIDTVCHNCLAPRDTFSSSSADSGDSYYDEPSWDGSAVNGRGDEDFDPLNLVASQMTLMERLLIDLEAIISETRQLPIAEFLIGNLDDNGWLRCSVREVSQALGVDEDEVSSVLALLQSLEPIGIGARDLRECMLIQVAYLESQGHSRPLLRPIITDYFDEVAEHKYQRIAQGMKIPVEEVTAACQFIRRQLNPFPAQQEGLRPRSTPSEIPRYVLPDVIINKNVEGELVVDVVESKRFVLRINPQYQQLWTQVESRPAAVSEQDREHVRQYISRAKMFMANLNQRRQTMQKIGDFLAEHQVDFLIQGIRHLKPLTRAMVAAATGMHESTVSRATAGKYVMIPSGQVIPFSDFFTAALNVKDVIKELIDHEAVPMTDQDIVEKLEQYGHHIARRTVAKYRDQLGILPSSLRG